MKWHGSHIHHSSSYQPRTHSTKYHHFFETISRLKQFNRNGVPDKKSINNFHQPHVIFGAHGCWNVSFPLLLFPSWVLLSHIWQFCGPKERTANGDLRCLNDRASRQAIAEPLLERNCVAYKKVDLLWCHFPLRHQVLKSQHCGLKKYNMTSRFQGR